MSSRRMHRLGVSMAAALLIGTTPVRLFAGQQPPGREYDIKAAFLYNFVRLVEWPEGAFKSESEDLRIVILGHDSFDGALDRLVAGKTVNRHRIVIVYSTHLSQARAAQVVFVSASAQKRLPDILSALKGSPTLTVSDIDRFADGGGVIGFVMDGVSVRFAINRAAAHEARLRVSSRLLLLATLVGSPPTATR